MGKYDHIIRQINTIRREIFNHQVDLGAFSVLEGALDRAGAPTNALITAQQLYRELNSVSRGGIMFEIDPGTASRVTEKLHRILAYLPDDPNAKAAAVVAAAKAVGTAKARPVSPALRSIIARDIVEIRASLQRGYINIKTARHLFGTLDNAYKSGVEAVKVAVDAASAILYYLSKVDGAQMLEPPEEMNGRIQQKLWVIVNSIRESGY